MSTLVPDLQFPAADAALRRRGQGVRPLLDHEFDWTAERVETLKAMWAAGKTQGEIADVLGVVSRSAIGGKIFRLGIAKREVRPPRQERAARPRGRPVGTFGPKTAADPWVSTAEMPEGRLYFEDLTRDVCHFPVGAPPYLFCGADTAAGPYCPSCTAIAHRA